MRFSPLAALLTSLLVASCATTRDQLVRGQHAFEQNEHERALALLRNMENDVPNLTFGEQAEYAYLRGMADYRMGYRVDARHWLSLAAAYDEAAPGTLATEWKARASEALAELNALVYDEGYATLFAAKGPSDEEVAHRPASKKTPLRAP